MNQNMMNQNMMNQNMMNMMNNMMNPNMMNNMMNQNMMAQNMMTQMLAQQQQNNNFNQGNTGNQNQSQQSQNSSNSGNNPGGISVFFRKSGNGVNDPPIMIQCTLNEKVSELIKRYRTKSNDHQPKKFIFNAKQLNETLSCAEAGLTNNSNIFVVTTEGVKGAN